MQWRLIQTRMVSMMQRKCLLDTNLTSSDTDGDGLTDFEEVKGYHTYEQINSSLYLVCRQGRCRESWRVPCHITSLEEKNKVEQSGLPIPGWVGAILKRKVLGNG